MNEARSRVDATAVARLIDAGLGAATIQRSLGPTRSTVTTTRGTWPITVTVTGIYDYDGISISLEEEPFESDEPKQHAESAITVICANLDDERTRRA